MREYKKTGNQKKVFEMQIVKAAMTGLTLFLLASISSARAEPVTIVVGFAPGGTSYSIAEHLADALGAIIGEKVYVESRAGVSGKLAAKYVRQLDAGSRTFLLLSSTAASVVPPDYGLSYIAQVAAYDYVFVTRGSNPAPSLKAYFEAIKENDALRNVSSAGLGTVPHLIADAIFREHGATMVHVPYPGSRPAVLNVIGGHVEAALVPKPDVASLLQSVHVLASTGNGIEEEGWIGMLGPRRMKPADIERWAELFRKASLAAQQKMEAQAFRQKWRTGPELQALHERGYYRFLAALKRLNIEFAD